MEKNDDRIVLLVLLFLGEVYNITADFCQQLRNELVAAGTIRAPASDIVCRTHEAGAYIHIWVEVLIQAEDSLTCEMDISQHNEGWMLDSRVARVDESGTNTVLQFPHIVAPNFAIIEREAPLALKRLYEAGTKILREELQS